MVVGGSMVVVVGGVVEVVSSGMSWLGMLCDRVVMMMVNGRLIRWVYVCVDVRFLLNFREAVVVVVEG